jgi:hypothetical protein
MAFYIDLFSPETYEAFAKSQRNVSGFRLRQRNVAERIKMGDLLVCYVTRLSRWCGLLEVTRGPYIDKSPIFVAGDDPFVVRFDVGNVSWLPLEKALPIHDAEVWSALSFTRELEVGSTAWTGKVRGSLVRLEDDDGLLLRRLIERQLTDRARLFPLLEADEKRLTQHSVHRADKTVSVSVPDDRPESEQTPEPQVTESEGRESIKIQAMIADIGAQMGLSIWLPKSDRGLVQKEWAGAGHKILERLPLNYDDTTLRTIEQIDVLWLRGRSIVRAFEIEHTTAVYSGILRMADLLALQPNMDIKLHIVAPIEKREKVFSEIRRPVFSLLEKGPLAESCTYLSYESIRGLASQRHLAHLSDTVLDEYAEDAE